MGIPCRSSRRSCPPCQGSFPSVNAGSLGYAAGPSNFVCLASYPQPVLFPQLEQV